MSAATTVPAAEAPSPRSASFLRRGLRSAAIGAAIGVIIDLLYGQMPQWTTAVQSMCFGVMIWLFIEIGRALAVRWKYRRVPADASAGARPRWPGWPLMLVVVVLGSTLGFICGGLLGELITGRAAPGYWRGDLRQAFALALSSLLPALIITYWFRARHIIAAHEAAVQAAQRQAAENQLKLLESQLEPHMLFNTLANLRVLIGTDPPRAQAMLDRLIAFLRATLSASRSASQPLRDEFARLRDYLALMELRMGERLQVRLHLPEDLAALPMPPLLLQPLVENGIKHGLEPKVEGGLVDVSAARERDAADGAQTLVLRVRDTGVGLDDDAAGTDGASGTRFGLEQVRERLATLYGGRARFTLERAGDAAGGTLATVRIPVDALDAPLLRAAPRGTAP